MSKEGFNGNFETQKPNLKDMIKIDGRWAQYVGDRLVRFLDTDKVGTVNLDEYQLVRNIRMPLAAYIEYNEDLPSEEEVKNVFEGETKMGLIIVFGEYEKLKTQ